MKVLSAIFIAFLFGVSTVAAAGEAVNYELEGVTYEGHWRAGAGPLR